MSQKLTLMAIFAHPDDEVFGSGGTLAKYAQTGVDVHLVMATRGEAGEIANPNVTLTQPMGMLREHELRCACQNYGLKALHLLGYMDGQTTIAPQGEAVYKVVKLLREIKPQVLISFGPEGVYGHYDHLAVHRWATAAVQLAADATRWPELGLPHGVTKFYHRAMPQEQVARIEQISGRSYIPMDGIPFSFLGYPLEEITTIIDVSEYADIKLNAIRCHASQLAPSSPYLKEDLDPLTHPWFCQETFILAKYPSHISITPANGKEDDLFAGLR